ncbi:unnamed protein product, partial [Ectocarpus sp. 12 AP-2014]
VLRRSAVLLRFGTFHPENWTEECSGPVADWIHRTISLLFGAPMVGASGGTLHGLTFAAMWAATTDYAHGIAPGRDQTSPLEVLHGWWHTTEESQVLRLLCNGY